VGTPSPAVPAVPAPAKIAAALATKVFGQPDAVREISVALAKKLANLRVGNVLLIGSSGSGKTTLMRAVEDMLAATPALASRSTVVRIHANVLGEDAQQGRAGETVLLRLLERAREQLGRDAPLEHIVQRASRGLVFIDEVDKIRSRVGDQVHVAGIRAQEALLTIVVKALIFVFITASFYGYVASHRADVNVNDPAFRKAVSPLNPSSILGMGNLVRDASTASFHLAMMVGAALLILGAIVNAIGIQDPARVVERTVAAGGSQPVKEGS